MLTGSIPPAGLPASKHSLLLICFSQMLALCAVFHFSISQQVLMGSSKLRRVNFIACFYGCDRDTMQCGKSKGSCEEFKKNRFEIN